MKSFECIHCSKVFRRSDYLKKNIITENTLVH